MIFTTEEWWLFHLYKSDTVETTVSVVLDALEDIDEPEVAAAALGLLQKMFCMDDGDLEILVIEVEDYYDE